MRPEPQERGIMENILTLEHVTKRYPDFSLEDVSFSVPAGSIMGFIGENGAGKSTTMKLILNLLQKDGGRITLFGRDNTENERALRERVAVVFSELNLPEALTARQAGRIMAGACQKWEPQTFHGYLERFGLKPDMKIRAYSRGMKMKLAIAMALSRQVQLLLLDEPTSGLDPVVRDEILELFQDFLQDETHSILISSHIVGDLEKIADYITLIHQGRLLFSQEKDLLLDRYRLARGPEEAFADLDGRALTGLRAGRFGSEALLDLEQLGQRRLPESIVLDPAGIEDVMLFFVKGGKRL